MDSLASNLSRHAAVYAVARPNHPAFASYETIADVLAALGQSSHLSAGTSLFTSLSGMAR